MSGPSVVVLGGGEHARVVIEALRDATTPMAVRGYVDVERRPLLEERCGVVWLGTDEDLAAHGEAVAILGFGSTRGWAARSSVVARVGAQVAGWATVRHRAAWVSPSARLGEGTLVLPGAIVHAGAVVGAHCVVNSGAIVEHDCRLGINVHVAPGAVLGGGVTIGDDAYVGLGAVVRDHVRIGRGALLAMGATVVADVGDGGTVTGLPARAVTGRSAGE